MVEIITPKVVFIPALLFEILYILYVRKSRGGLRRTITGFGRSIIWSMIDRDAP